MWLPERLAGAVFGHLVGDALGVPYEFMQPGAIEQVVWRGGGAHGQPAGTWSDDGALMLALLDSLLPAEGSAPRFDPEDQGRRAVTWWRTGAYAPGGRIFDIGDATRGALERIERGVPAVEAGATDALGNGSLMRILPLALAMRDVPDAELVRLATIASGVTHGSVPARIACAMASIITRRILCGNPDRGRILEDAAQLLRAGPPAGVTAADVEAFLGWAGRHGRGLVTDSFWSAWDAFEGSADYPDAVRRAVAYGHDTDTTAAIAGGWAGAWYGVRAIPDEWLYGLRDRQVPGQLVGRLIESDGWLTSARNPLRLDMLDTHGVPGLDHAGDRIGLTSLPGKQHDGLAGRHWRDLEHDATRLRDEHGVSVLVLFVEDQELARFGATRIEEVMADHAIDLIRHPINDARGEPPDMDAYRALVRDILVRVRRGAKVALACRGGIDRTGMTAACLLCEAGAGADEAIARVQRSRVGSLRRPVQQDIVRAWQPPRPAPS